MNLSMTQDSQMQAESRDAPHHRAYGAMRNRSAFEKKKFGKENEFEIVTPVTTAPRISSK
jgi:hypothetical protein